MIFSFAFFLMLIASPARADAPGATSLDFLKLGGSPQQQAMGMAGTAIFDPAGSPDLNPASLGGLTSRMARFSFDQLYAGTTYGVVGYGQPLPKGGNVAGQIEYLDYGSIPSYDAAGGSLGNVTASDRLATLSWSMQSQTWTPGISLKLAQETLDNVTGSAVAADAGVIYKPVIGYGSSSDWLSHLSFGAAVLNAGSGPTFDSAQERLPLTFAAGVAHTSFADALTLAADFERVTGRSETLDAHLGAQLWLKDVLAIRIGYRTDIDIGPGISAGVGFRFNDLQIDYAFTPFGAIGYAHRAGLSMRFGASVVDRYYDQGVEAMREGRNADAVAVFDKALAIEPHNSKVLEKALEAAKALEATEPQRNETPANK